jgi:DNA gyrase inhibitor GyrI
VKIMSELNVRIVKLEPMRVVSTAGFGQGPEGQAWDKLQAWLEKKGLMGEIKARRFFGFNNPEPSPGSPNYGYEQWMEVGPEVEPEGDVRVKSFSGGMYAVTRTSLAEITPTWKQLVLWREGSKYRPARHQWLEECLTPFAPFEAMQFDIYLPIAE